MHIEKIIESQEISLYEHIRHFIITLQHLGVDDDSIHYKILSAIDDNTSEE